MSNIPPKPITIYANGQCVSSRSNLRELAEKDGVDTLEIIINGNRLLSGKTTTLLGEGNKFLPASRKFRLTHFAPQADGQCVVRYVREHKKQE